MNRIPSSPPLPTPIEVAHAPELAILFALDTLLAMTTVTIHLALPECPDPEPGDPELVVAQDILDRIRALRNTLQIYQRLTLQP